MAVSTVSPVPSSEGSAATLPEGGPVIACIDDTRNSHAVARAAADYARSFGRPLVLFHVIEHDRDPSHLPDPFEWNLRRQEARRNLDRLRESLPDLSQEVLLELEEGNWLGALADRKNEGSAMLVVGAPKARGSSASRLGRQLAEAHPGSVLLVPPGYAPRAARPARIAVPIDGSNFAESALVEATRLAPQLGAELLLVHVVPDAGLADFGPPATSDLELRLAVDRRNERVACGFLERTRRRLIDQGLAVRSLCLKGETRSALLRAFADEMPDLVVLSPKGQGGRRCSDLSIGSTASYLLDHLAGPILLVKSERTPDTRHAQLAPGERMPGPAFAG